MDNYVEFKKHEKIPKEFFVSQKSQSDFLGEGKKEFDLGYGMVFINTEDKMNDFIDK